jgi:hypothetical protein
VSTNSNEGQRSFTQFYDDLFQYYKLPSFNHGHCVMYLALKSHRYSKDEETIVFPGRERLGEMMEIEVRQVCTLIKDLEKKFKLIEVERTPGLVNKYKVKEPLTEREFSINFLEEVMLKEEMKERKAARKRGNNKRKELVEQEGVPAEYDD